MTPEEQIAGTLSKPQEKTLAALRASRPFGLAARAIPRQTLAALARRGLVRAAKDFEGATVFLSRQGEQVVEALWSPCDDCGDRTPPSGLDVAFDAEGREVFVCSRCLSTRDSEGYPARPERQRGSP
jgi:hypothetical protein